MKKLLTGFMTALLSLGLVSPIYGLEIPDYQEASVTLNTDKMLSVKFTEKEFIDSLTDQGFEVHKVQLSTAENAAYKKRFSGGKSVPQKAVQATRFVIQIPVRSVPAAPRGTGTVPNAYHTIFTDYVTVQGFRYFVNIIEGSIELVGASQYAFTKYAQTWSLINGDQGVTFTTTGQFSYSYSAGLSASVGWVGVSGSTGYYYYYPSVCETSTYNWPLVG
ncbi:hypothetical protein IM774_12515 [Erysipelotrichaceae bacterium RD49]|nr:hypothetical protein [Erysipelotrichaceae bacterium RD49]